MAEGGVRVQERLTLRKSTFDRIGHQHGRIRETTARTVKILNRERALPRVASAEAVDLNQGVGTGPRADVTQPGAEQGDMPSGPVDEVVAARSNEETSAVAPGAEADSRTNEETAEVGPGVEVALLSMPPTGGERVAAPTNGEVPEVGSGIKVGPEARPRMLGEDSGLSAPLVEKAKEGKDKASTGTCNLAEGELIPATAVQKIRWLVKGCWSQSWRRYDRLGQRRQLVGDKWRTLSS